MFFFVAQHHCHIVIFALLVVVLLCPGKRPRGQVENPKAKRVQQLGGVESNRRDPSFG
jgi:hypothetical protein